MQDHFNKLSPAEAERLAMLAEECGEVIQIIGKILRHGYGSHHPNQPLISNRGLLSMEMNDVFSVWQQFEIHDHAMRFHLSDTHLAWQKKLRFAHHQETLAVDPADALRNE